MTATIYFNFIKSLVAIIIQQGVENAIDFVDHVYSTMRASERSRELTVRPAFRAALRLTST